MLKVEIRELKEEDIEACAMMTYNTSPWIDYELTLENAKRFLQEKLGKSMVFVAINQNEVVGYYAFDKSALYANYLKRMVVREDLRDQGIGSTLLNHFESNTLQNKIPNVFLLCSVKNIRACEFYKRAGYHKVGTIKNYIDDGIDEVLMWKSFGSVKEMEEYK